MILLKFESRLKATTEEVWQSITSLEGLTSEMMPFIRLTVPKGYSTLSDIFPRKPDSNFRSWVLLFGIIPIDHTDLNLKSLTLQNSFVEESKMGSMKFWCHERKIVPAEPGRVTVVDELTFEPKRFEKLTEKIVKLFFKHRHKNLRKRFYEN